MATNTSPGQGRVVGGVLLPNEAVRGHRTTLTDAFEQLRSGQTNRIVLPHGATTGTAIVESDGNEVRPAPGVRMAARIRGVEPAQLSTESAWVIDVLAESHGIPLAEDLYWVRAADGELEAWVPFAYQPPDVETSPQRFRCSGRQRRRLRG